MVVNDLRGLLRLVRPDIDAAIAEIDQRAPARILCNGHIRNSIVETIERDFYGLIHRTLITDYKIVETKVSFTEYCDLIENNDVRNHIFARYPMLSKWVENLRPIWIQRIVDLLLRFDNDESEINSHFRRHSTSSELFKIRFGLGDSHRGGQSVALIEYDDGSKLVYKPRSLLIDTHLSTIIDHINSESSISLRMPIILPREGYGWVEWIEHRSCLKEEEVNDHYYRTGMLLALLYVLNAYDFHYENIIAHGACPILIDLETFFHPQSTLDGVGTRDPFDDSVLGTGLLPRRVTLNNGQEADISGMTDVQGQVSPISRLVVRQNEHGTLYFERSFGEILGAHNVPLLHDCVVEPTSGHVLIIQNGFKEVYNFISAKKDDFVDRLRDFHGAEVRLLLRNTLAYSHLLDESRHPALMMSEAKLRAFFGGLQSISEETSLNTRLIECEMDDLMRRDVPMFTFRLGSRDLIVKHGVEIKDFFATDGFADAVEKIHRLDQRDLDRQLWIIDQAFRSISVATADGSLNAPLLKKEPLDKGADKQSVGNAFIDGAVRVADYICDSIFQDSENASWIVKKAADEEFTQLSVSNAFYDLYGGMPGEILFLDQISRHLSNDYYRVVADKAYHFLRLRLNKSRFSIRPLGLFAGWGSVLMLSTALGRWRQDPALFDQTESFLDQIDFPALIDADRNFAMIRGTAGFLIACAEHIKATGSVRARKLAARAFDHLIAHRDQDNLALSWRVASKLPLSGLSHGASGFAVAFGRMFEATGDNRYAEACYAALKFERTLYAGEHRNWRDQRDYTLRTGGAARGLSWAHGAPGIGIARLSLIRSGLTSPEILDDLEIAVKTTVDSDLTGELPLVSGDFGTIELLLGYQEMVGDTHAAATRSRLERMINGLEQRISPLIASQTAPLGLMAGLTGVGYQCLRIGSPATVPPLLALQLTPTAGAGESVGERLRATATADLAGARY
jgi:type 2 lantibiotic biosynthesis protein LanM